jgi:hypothetical protein
MSRLTFTYEKELENSKWWQFIKKWRLKMKIDKINKIHKTGKYSATKL